MEKWLPETTENALSKTPVTQKEVDAVAENMRKSKDIATENARKEVYEKFETLEKDKSIQWSLKDARKIIESMEWNKITPQEALKQLSTLEVILRSAFVPPAF